MRNVVSDTAKRGKKFGKEKRVKKWESNIVGIIEQWKTTEEEDEEEKKWGSHNDGRAEGIKEERGCTIGTARVYASHHRRWDNFAEAKEVPQRFRPSKVYPAFVKALMEDAELQQNSAQAVVYENIRRHQLEDAVKWTKLRGKSLECELNLTRQIISNTCRNANKELSKAVPISMEVFRSMSQELKMIILLWINSGVRLDTLCHLHYEDVNFIQEDTTVVRWRSLYSGCGIMNIV